MTNKTRRGRLPESLYRHIWRTSRRHQFGLVLLTIAVFPLTMVPLELQRRIVNDAIEGEDFSLLVWLGIAYFSVLLLQGGLKLALRIYRGYVSEGTVRSLRRRAFQASGPGTGETAEESAKDRGSRVSMMVAEVEPVGSFVGESVSEPLLHAGTLVSIFGYMLWIQPLMALAGMAFCLPQLYFVPRIQEAINRRAKQRIEILRNLSRQVADYEDPHRSDTERAAVERINQIYGLRMRIFLLKYTLKFLNNFLHHLGPLSAYLFGGWLVLEGRTDLGTVVAFASGFERVSDPWRELITFYRSASDARLKYRLVADAIGA
ncbi:MAG TPA: ABC transporter ATP-binding protein [Gammaproteobacteria bacterium]|nr:ABC transporter ATP-binding protein [Gammaproteobacteria bacterium]